MSEQMAKITNIGTIRLTGTPTSTEYEAQLERARRKTQIWHNVGTCGSMRLGFTPATGFDVSLGLGSDGV